MKNKKRKYLIGDLILLKDGFDAVGLIIGYDEYSYVIFWLHHMRVHHPNETYTFDVYDTKSKKIS